jgi:hypothetical protein
LNAHKRGRTHSGAHAASGHPEPSRRHSRSPGSNRCPRRSGCKLPGSGFPYGVGERTSVEDGNVCATQHPLRRKRAAAPSTQALLPRPDRWFGPVRECRFRPLQIGVDVGRRCRALNVFCLRDLGINTRREVPSTRPLSSRWNRKCPNSFS